MLKTHCPQCRKNIIWQDNPYRPFCSRRCQLIDLGQWVEGEYRVAGESADSYVQEDEEHNSDERQDNVIPFRKKG